MADAIDDLEARLRERLRDGGADGSEVLLMDIYLTLDAWRKVWGGDRVYIARRATHRRNREIQRLATAGVDTETIALATGVSPSQVRRVKKSSYL